MRFNEFLFGQSKIQVVKYYTYLGTVFASTGKSKEASKQRISKANLATGMLKQTLAKAKPRSLAAAIKLFESIVSTTLLYGVEIWGNDYLKNIESTQVRFFKYILNWPRTTPNYMIRLEVNRTKLEVAALRRSLGWWSKLLEMSNDRLPKRCYLKMLSMRANAPNFVKTNWVARMEARFTKLNFSEVFESQDPHIIKGRTDEIVEALTAKIRFEDILAAQNSTDSALYREIMHANGYIHEKMN